MVSPLYGYQHMSEAPINIIESVRLLECWLPLAQAVCQDEAWDDDSEALGVLVLEAAPILRHASSVHTARVILVWYHTMVGAA
jgi:hypothetical protein